MGPLISSNQERVVQDYIKYGLDAGFDLVTGGHKLSGDGYDHGYYVEPTIFDRRRQRRPSSARRRSSARW